MKGAEVKNILRKTGLTLSEIAERMNESSQALNSLLSAQDIKTGVLERIAAAIEKDVPYFYGVDGEVHSAIANGENSTAVAGRNNNTNSERFVALLEAKDRQIDRLLTIIENLNK